MSGSNESKLLTLVNRSSPVASVKLTMGRINKKENGVNVRESNGKSLSSSFSLSSAF